MAILTFVGLVSGALVVISVSTVYSVLWLVITFIVVSILLGFLNLGFPALLYVIVYVGAIAILFLFVIQLLDLGNDSTVSPFNASNSTNYSSSFYWTLSYLITLVVLGVVTFTKPYSHHVNLEWLSVLAQNTLSYDNYHVYYTNMLWPDIVSSGQTVLSSGKVQVESLSNWLYGTGLLPLIVISIILLLAMIAPISLCKDRLVH